EECIRSFNETVPELIDFVGEDAIILAFGDHGEEFEHGHYDHERLYDECVHVPLYYKNIAEFADGPLRQVDLAPNLLNAIDIPIPDRWEGTIETPVSTQPAYMLTPENDTGLLHVGIRKENSKLIRSYDRQNGNIVRNEYYNLEDDPNEIKNIYNSVDVRKMEEKLEQFLSDHQAALDIDLSTNMETKIVESRLEDLGYK
ncbi:MAG: sulfatase/phosphatase domain-containing protein, partial [Candidatus Paceibacteria bacterium]